MTYLALMATAISALAAVGLLTYTIWHYHRLREEADDPDPNDDFPIPVGKSITVEELGELEGGIKGLVKVIVAANQVQDPSICRTLRVAVERNFERRVEYLFLISKSHAEREVNGYYNIFRAIAHIVLARSPAGLAVGIDSLVKIMQLKHEWRDTPYVFYESETDGIRSIVAFRGDTVDAGIARYYTRLLPGIAFTIANTSMSDAPQPLSIKSAPFDRTPEVEMSPSPARTSASAEQ